MTRPHVTVLGAGIVGACTALALQREGFRVTLLDRDEPGSGCSAGNAGMIQTGSVAPLASPGLLGRLPRMLLDREGPLVIRWRHLLRLAPWLLGFARSATPERLEATATALAALLARAGESTRQLVRAAGAEHLLGAKGELYVHRAASPAGLAEKFALYQRHGIEFVVLDEPALRQMEPALSRDYRSGYYLPESFHTLDPQRLTRALAEDFARRGGEIRRAEVRGIRIGPDGSRALRTAEGEIPIEALVIAAGAFSRPFAAALGANVPLETLRGYHIMIPHDGLALQGPVIEAETSFGAVPMTDGIRIAGTVELAGLAAPPDWRRAEMLLPMARRMFPGLRGDIASRWMGHRPGTPDSLPVISPAPGHRDIWFAFGHGTLGLTLAAITGQLVAEGLAGHEPSVDLTPYRAARF
jgi:glycine/D-amino acid oxidase-like deaminating enzyme